MKRSKTLICYFIITISLALISLFSFKQKGNDFFIALSSISADLTLLISVGLVVYSLFFCCIYIKEKIEKKDKKLNQKTLISLSILLLTLIVTFMSFINIYSHKNIFEFIKAIIDKKESTDIITLFIIKLLVYISIFMFAVIGIFIGDKKNKDEEINRIIYIVASTIFILFIIRMLFSFRLLYLVIIIDVILYITIFVLFSNKKVKKK